MAEVFDFVYLGPLFTNDIVHVQKSIYFEIETRYTKYRDKR